jgi:putative acetyltransferase
MTQKGMATKTDAVLIIRPITAADDVRIAVIIRESLREHGVARPGTAYYDSSTDTLTAYFETGNCAYYVAQLGETVVGGVGIYPTMGLPEATCELVKMYIGSQYRNRGIGKALIEQATAFAKAQGYRYMYLESMPELEAAVAVYKRLGFETLDAPLGNTGHFGCDIWMLRAL